MTDADEWERRWNRILERGADRANDMASGCAAGMVIIEAFQAMRDEVENIKLEETREKAQDACFNGTLQRSTLVSGVQ